MPRNLRQQTIAAAAGVAADAAHGAVAPPLHLSATFAWRDADTKPEYDYSRSGNPTRDYLGSALAELEGAACGIVTASGMAAVDLVLNLAGPGDLVLAPHDCYGGSHRLLTARAAKGDFRVAFVDQTNARAFEQALTQRPKLVIVETPSNPLLRVTDIAACVRAAQAAGALVAVDNTFLSPALQQPIALGADLVIHSTTKYINGHSDVVGGAVLAADAALGETLAWWANCRGVTGAPFDSYLTLRGLRTLFPRIAQQQATAQALVDHLQTDDRVARIYYPGLPDHPGADIAARQQHGPGAMFSVAFAAHVDIGVFLRQLRIFTIAESLGGFESLVCRPSGMTHAAMTPKARAEAGLDDGLIRFSIGLEHADDLKRDLVAALDAAAQAAGTAGSRRGSRAGTRPAPLPDHA
ncbi:MAG: cystathionine gamma-synthase [Parvularculaceae bacterium]